MSTLPLTPVADVTINLPAVAAPRASFSLGLVIGSSPVISTDDRVVVFGALAEILDAGFTDSDPEYLAAVKYFAATSSPTQIAIGRQFSGESMLTAVEACRAANSDWYIVYCPAADDNDHEDIAAYMEALTDNTGIYFLQTSETPVLNNDNGNLFATLKAGGYNKTLGMYSTSAHAVAAVMGYAMGQTSDFAGSAYTLFAKRLPTVTVDGLTTQQVNNIEGNRGNVYVNRGSFYDMFEKGQMFGGAWFDEIIYLDKLANEIQLNVADLLYQSPKIPQTADGVGMIENVIGKACADLVGIGFIAPGTWTGGNILNLRTGDTLPTGYRVLSQDINQQSQADRDARKSPSIFVAIKLAGAIQSVIIEIDVNR
jgi:hypothetical protein